MTTAKWLVYIIFMFCGALLVSFFMEIYKKSIRKNKYHKVECWVIGGVLSVLFVAFLKFCGMFYPMLNTMFGAKLWLDYGIHIILFYVIQLNADLHIVKKVVTSLVKQWLKSNAGLNDDQIELLLQTVKLNETKEQTAE